MKTPLLDLSTAKTLLANQRNVFFKFDKKKYVCDFEAPVLKDSCEWNDG